MDFDFDKKGLKGNNVFHLALIVAFAFAIVFLYNSTYLSALPRVNNTGSNAITVTLNVSNHTSSAKGNATHGYVINEDTNYLFNFSINYTSIDGAAQENLTNINVTLRGLTYLVTAAEGLIGQFGANFSITFGWGAENGNGSVLNNWTRTNMTNSNGDMVLLWNGSIAGNNTLVFMDRNATGETVGLNYSKIWFNASASTPGAYPLTIRFFTNYSAGSMGNETNFTIIVNDTTPPSIINFSYNLSVGEIQTPSYANVSGSIVINISVVDNGNFSLTLNRTDAREISYVNVTVWNASGGELNKTYSASNLSAFGWNGNYWNVTINTAQFPDGVYNISIWANDSENNFNSTNISLVRFDNTAPTASASCSPATVNTGDTVTCTCSPSDGGSGVNTSATSITANPSTTNTGTFTNTCTFADLAGKTGTTSATYTVEQSSSGGAGAGTSTSGSAATAGTVAKAQTFTKITPGVASIVKNFDAETGLKEIQIEVKNEAQNVKVSVTKYENKPAAVSVEKAGKVFQYMQIKVDNVVDKLEKAKISTKVKKTWVSENGLAKDKVGLFKFDETAGKWNELTTTYTSEDDTYYYYDAEVASFSYFAIGERGVVEVTPGTGTTPSGDTTTGTAGGTNLTTWLWIVIGLVVVAAIAWFVWSKRK